MASASTSVVNDQKRDLFSGCLNVFSGAFAAALVRHDIEIDLLPLDEGAHAGAFEGRDVNENVRLAVALLDKAKAFGCVKELHCSRGHYDFLSIDIDNRRLAVRQTLQISKLSRKIV